jgi:hypothetical protein
MSKDSLKTHLCATAVRSGREKTDGWLLQRTQDRYKYYLQAQLPVPVTL